MNSRTTIKFRQEFDKSPVQVQKQARIAYRQFKKDSTHSSLRFKKVHPTLPIYSARINRNYRAVAQLDGNTAIWFWIGSHSNYEKLLASLGRNS